MKQQKRYKTSFHYKSSNIIKNHGCFTYGFILTRDPSETRLQWTTKNVPKFPICQNSWVELGWFPTKNSRKNPWKPEKSHESVKAYHLFIHVHSYFSVRSTQKVGAIWNIQFPLHPQNQHETPKIGGCFFMFLLGTKATIFRFQPFVLGVLYGKSSFSARTLVPEVWVHKNPTKCPSRWHRWCVRDEHWVDHLKGSPAADAKKDAEHHPKPLRGLVSCHPGSNNCICLSFPASRKIWYNIYCHGSAIYKYKFIIIYTIYN